MANLTFKQKLKIAYTNTKKNYKTAFNRSFAKHPYQTTATMGKAVGLPNAVIFSLIFLERRKLIEKANKRRLKLGLKPFPLPKTIMHPNKT